MGITIAALYFSCFTCWFLWKYFFLSDYETGKIEYPATQIGHTLAQNFDSLSHLKDLVGFFFGVYPEEMIAGLVVLIFLLRKKNELQAVLLFVSVLVLILLIAFTQEQPWRHSYYFERMYLLLIPLSFASFAMFVFPSLKYRFWIESVFVLILILRFSSIMNHSTDYSSHIARIKSLISKAKQQEGSKFTVDYSVHPELASLDEWSLPMETLIFSSLENHDHSVTVSWKADVANPAIASKLNNSTFRLRLDEIFPDDWLNANYFHLKHGDYKELKW